METLSFAFGVLTIIGVALVTAVVVGMVKVVKMQNQLEGLEKWVSDSESNIMRELENRESSLSRILSEDRRELNHRIDETYRYVDSRFDKMENKLSERYEAARRVLNNKMPLND
jgi:hypothetical protein